MTTAISIVTVLEQIRYTLSAEKMTDAAKVMMVGLQVDNALGMLSAGQYAAAGVAAEIANMDSDLAEMRAGAATMYRLSDEEMRQIEDERVGSEFSEQPWMY